MSIFQDFTWSNDWVTLQQPWQIWRRLWLPQRLLIFNDSDSWRKERLQVDVSPSCKVCQNGFYRLASLWFWRDATQTWWTFETSWKYCTFMFAWVAAQIDPESTAGHANVKQSATIHLAITRTVCIICEMIIFCQTSCNYVTIQFYARRSNGCFTFCFLLGAMRWLSCKSTAKEVHLRIWHGPMKHFRPPKIRCCHSGR